MARKHLPLSPEPMYKSKTGKEMFKEMGLNVKSQRIKSKLNVDDVSNEAGKRARGGY